MTLSEPGLRLLAAAVLVLLYVAMCAAIWWRERRQRARAQHEAAALASAREGALPCLWPMPARRARQRSWHARLRGCCIRPVRACICAPSMPLMWLLAQTQRALFIASTYGEGDPPDNAALFLAHSMAQAQDLSHLQYGLLALGDRQYAQFCGFGRALDGWLRAAGASPWFERIEMDNGAPQALTAWQHQLTQISSLGDMPAWEMPVFSEWTLAARRHMNPGSAGEPVFHIELQPLQRRPRCGSPATWRRSAFLRTRSIRASTPSPPSPRTAACTCWCARRGARTARRAWPRAGSRRARPWGSHHPAAACAPQFPAGRQPAAPAGADRQRHGSGRPAQPPACAPQQAWGPTGCCSASAMPRMTGSMATSFRPGARAACCSAWTWLSRAIAAKARRAPMCRTCWRSPAICCATVEQGAAIYVCGSLQGMAQGVDQALHAVLGEAQMDQLVRSGRYRRDVY